ncbi:unnamed protein product [Echinostoma caproni]|uniref:Gag-pro-like protein n=1 Tax=Echinostoma caproni TaxID=27848 RepID=A0A183BEI9_9TREM|nr:unnamed protein product [Echinostoma caproni]
MAIMHKSSTPQQWYQVKGPIIPDDGTRGLKADDQKRKLVLGPPFLRSLEEIPPRKLVFTEEIEGQIELKRTVAINQTTVAMSVSWLPYHSQ